jgi:hypothetical protein
LKIDHNTIDRSVINQSTNIEDKIFTNKLNTTQSIPYIKMQIMTKTKIVYSLLGFIIATTIATKDKNNLRETRQLQGRRPGGQFSGFNIVGSTENALLTSPSGYPSSSPSESPTVVTTKAETVSPIRNVFITRISIRIYFFVTYLLLLI